MAALKLFISHSTLLETGGDAAAGHDLLSQTCLALRNHYGTAIDILVDREGLPPASVWRDRLDAWLGECDAAIVLFSKRALHDSAWVRFEASVLRWRASREPTFKLIPVLVKDEAKPEDLEQDIWQAIGITRLQVIRAAATGEDIVKAIEPALGDPKELAVQEGFGSRFKVIWELFSEHHNGRAGAHGDALRRTWDVIADPDDTLPAWPTDPVERYALALTKHLFHSPANDTPPPQFDEAVSRFQKIVENMNPPLLRQGELRDYILPLWVHEAAARALPDAHTAQLLIALNGRHVLHHDLDKGIACFTLHRYFQRSRLWLFEIDRLEEDRWNYTAVRDAIRSFIDGGDDWQDYGEDELSDLDTDIGKRDRPLFLVLPTQDAGLPDALEIAEMARLRDEFCPALHVIFATGASTPELPSGVVFLQPLLDLRAEKRHLRCECNLRKTLPGRVNAP